jgi:hypothetical protein
MVFTVNIIYGNLKSENSQDYAQKPQRNCTFMNSASGYASKKVQDKTGRDRTGQDMNGQDIVGQYRIEDKGS